MKQLLKTKRKRKGFTLIELIIVIAIIAILVVVAIPKFGEIRQKSNKSADLATSKTIHSLIAAKIADNNSTFATVTPATNVPFGTGDNEISVDGSTTPKTDSSQKYKYSVDASGNVTVYVGPTTMYPNN